MTLGEKLRSIRSQKGYTLTEVEQKTGVTQSYLSKIERGLQTNPSLEIMSALANFYDVDIKWLTKNNQDDDDPKTTTSTENQKLKQDIIDLLDLASPEDLGKILSIIKVLIYD